MNPIAPAVRHRFDVDAYHRLGETGVLAPDARVELIEGDIVDMAPIGWRHAGIVNNLNRLMVIGAGEAAIVSVQNPVRLSRTSEPQPDLLLLDPRTAHAQRLPEPADVLLLIEVADATLSYDRTVKADLYARHGIVETWIVDAQRACIEVLRVPRDGRYVERSVAAGAQVLAPAALPGLGVEVARVFA